ncbi:copper resistance CopC family protein [Micromonospora fluostatini]|uniref:copper resistance CopC family protein n=1 Tax=Micromonospora sp. JCM 30529 TaxID=3421643 RepID=UPI003D17C159
MRTRARRPTVRGVVVAALAATALTLAPASPAAAHNTLQSSTPTRDARLTTAPAQVTLRFLQPLNPAFTTIVLSDAGQRRVATGEPAVTGPTGSITIDQPLGNGTYTVAYRVVSADGHPVQGAYRFTVADPTAPEPADAAPPPASPAAASGAAGGGPPAPALVAGLVGVAGVGAVVTAVALRRRRLRTP